VKQGPRKTRRRFEIAGQPRFLTFSCYHRLPLFKNDTIKTAFVDHLRNTRTRLGFRLLAWVIMPEHVHLVLIPGVGSTMPLVLSAIKRPFAARVFDRWRDLHAPVLARLCDAKGVAHFWQAGGGYDRNLVTSAELLENINYCHTNPQARELVSSATDWVWSSALWYSGRRDLALIEIDEYTT
jgi:putative transposase